MDLVQEVKKVGEDLKKDLELFKKENDERIAKLEKSKGVSDIEEKLAKNNSSLEALEKKLEQLGAAYQRKGEVTESKDECKSILQSYLRKGKITSEQEAEYRKHLDETSDGYKALSVDNEADGGFLVRPTISAQITKKIFESSPLRQLASVETISSDAFEELYDNDEPSCGWVGERQARTETNTAKLNMVRIPVHEMYAEPKITQKLLDDAALDVEAWHQNKVVEKFARQEATAFVSGDGILKPKGLLSYAAGDGFDKVEQVNSGSAGLFTIDGLISLQNSLLEEFQAGASWLMKRASASAIRKLKSGDYYVWTMDPMNVLNGAPVFSLLGKPVRYADDMPAVGANALAAAYGDFKQGYLIVDRIGIRVLRDNLTTKGFVKLYTTKRVGGGVRQFQAIKLHKLAV